MSPSTRHSQHFRPTGQLILSDAGAIAVVLKQGDTVPHDSTVKRLGDRFRFRQGGSVALAAPSVSDNAAAEFDVGLSGAGPWDVTLTWVGASLAALAKGTYSRTITITSAGATNSPLAVPVTIRVL